MMNDPVMLTALCNGTPFKFRNGYDDTILADLPCHAEQVADSQGCCVGRWNCDHVEKGGAMFGKVFARGNPRTASTISTGNDNGEAAGRSGGRLVEMLRPSGRVDLSVLQKMRLILAIEDFIAFMQRPALVGAAVLSGTLRAPNTTRATDKHRTFAFEIMDTAEEAAASAGSLQQAIYPLIKNAQTLAARSRFVIGRLDGNDIVMPDLALSKRHAIIELTDGDYWLSDCGSTNGTMLNGHLLDQNPKPLCDGDVISFARYEFTFLSPESLYDKLRLG